MKLSESLLRNPDIGQRIFDNSIKKVKTVINNIFGLNLTKDSENIKEIKRDNKKYFFKIVFNFDGREITATLNFEKVKDDILQEVLKIHEYIQENLQIKDLPQDYEDCINKVMDILEKKYQLDFTPLDPEETDKNIKSIKEENQQWEVIFTHDDHEAEFKAIFIYSENKCSLTVKQHKQHVIYLE